MDDRNDSMTCIVGLEHKGKIYIGGDSRVMFNSTAVSLAAPKVFMLGGLLVGCAGVRRVAELVRYKVDPPAFCNPENLRDKDLDCLMFYFGEAIREAMRAGGAIRSDQGIETIEATILAGVFGRLYIMASNFSFSRVNRFAAIGCGMDFALGALYATEDLEPRKRVQVALESAAEFSDGVRGPFIILTET